MPPKKQKDDGAQNNAAKITMLDFEAKRLQMRIVEEQMRADRSKTQEMQLQQKYLSLEKDFKGEKDKLFNISTDMNRQYKQMQDELLKDINELNSTVKEKDEVIKTKEQQITDYRANYEEKLKKKDQDIAELRKKIDDMSLEFADMLKETLNKMQERIELAQWDNNSDNQVMRNFKEASGFGN
ncbi:unnamed protein product (macronuclear) [Paramecium tetraurelia]|uniref:Dynein regulatory complex protein 12 n=1 Tax=Paramecium tetraurelia TaxID=5888 RepID=A0E9S3_PARTE|nr:uncharacterized protein GSPATT00024771001 [Paramecium tetraurelia]CAK92040.1 unnamed protein product [Paramecium tetraurelia]|eukprot:XP_001459437.1 hypothetical protein (macronuclear) [Paramecium tetraurelia strain d4-2]